MQTVAGEWWELELVDGWEAEADEECYTLVHPEGVGALQLSAYQKKAKSPVTSADLLDATKLSEEMRKALAEQSWGEFHGYQFVYSQEDVFWRRWWLGCGRTMLFVTYNCDKEHSDVELAEINAILSSLRAK